MASGYPLTVDSLATNRAGDTVMSAIHPADHNDANDAINRLERTLRGDVDFGIYRGIIEMAGGSGMIAENFPISVCKESVTLSNTRTELYAVYIPVARTVTGVVFALETPGVGFTIGAGNEVRPALYTATTGTLTRVAVGTSGNALMTGAQGITFAPFTAPYAAAAGLYWLGYTTAWTAGATTVPKLLGYIDGFAGAVNRDLLGPILRAGRTTGTTTPASTAWTGVTTMANLHWFGLY